jgi:hypothetical protein
MLFREEPMGGQKDQPIRIWYQSFVDPAKQALYGRGPGGTGHGGEGSEMAGAMKRFTGIGTSRGGLYAKASDSAIADFLGGITAAIAATA